MHTAGPFRQIKNRDNNCKSGWLWRDGWMFWSRILDSGGVCGDYFAES